MSNSGLFQANYVYRKDPATERHKQSKSQTHLAISRATLHREGKRSSTVFRDLQFGPQHSLMFVNSKQFMWKQSKEVIPMIIVTMTSWKDYKTRREKEEADDAWSLEKQQLDSQMEEEDCRNQKECWKFHLKRVKLENIEVLNEHLPREENIEGDQENMVLEDGSIAIEDEMMPSIHPIMQNERFQGPILESEWASRVDLGSFYHSRSNQRNQHRNQFDQLSVEEEFWFEERDQVYAPVEDQANAPAEDQMNVRAELQAEQINEIMTQPRRVQSE